MNNLKVSVIIPVYNVELYLSECLTSVLEQTYRNIEVIIVDDCSTDNSFSLCQKYANADARIKLYKNKNNSGVSHSRNVALEHATGEYVIMIDSDDWIDKETIELMVNTIEKKGADSCACGYIREFENTKKQRHYEITKEMIVEDNKTILDCTMRPNSPFVGYVWGKLYRKKHIDAINLKFDETISLCEDSLFNYLHFDSIRNCVLLKECLWHYRIRMQSATRSAKAQSIKTRIEAFQKSLMVAEKYPDSIFHHRIKSAIFSSMVQYINSFYQNEINMDKQELEELMLNAKEVLKNTKKRYISKKSLVYYRILCYFPSLFRFIHNIRRRIFK